VYTNGMTKAQVRALMDSGKIYVAHFAEFDNTTGYQLKGGVVPTESAPGTGTWIGLSVDNHTQVAPNAEMMVSGNASRLALWGAMAKATSVGNALLDINWNGLAGFPSDNFVKTSLFTAAAKIGVMELNRPEDIEWNPKATKLNGETVARLFVAFTKHGRANQLNQDGIRYVGDASTDTWGNYHNEIHDANTIRDDAVGSIFAMEESNTTAPGSSMSFSYWRVFFGTGKSKTGVSDVANPDNLMIDADGGLWFGTDGNYSTNGTSDGLYYLDLDPAHRSGQSGISTETYGIAYRVIAGPSDSESTGPAFSSDMKTIFFSVQHPGESAVSTWPQK
jgi:secreted PhoX family phosphatase